MQMRQKKKRASSSRRGERRKHLDKKIIRWPEKKEKSLRLGEKTPYEERTAFFQRERGVTLFGRNRRRKDTLSKKKRGRGHWLGREKRRFACL